MEKQKLTYDDLYKWAEEMQQIISEHDIEALRKYLKNYCEDEIKEIHREYKKHILPLEETNILRQEIECIFEYLQIPYIKLEKLNV